MQTYFIITGTVTYAMMGQELLQRQGLNARAGRAAGPLPKTGCGWGIYIKSNPEEAVKKLKQNGVKVLGVVRADGLS